MNRFPRWMVITLICTNVVLLALVVVQNWPSTATNRHFLDPAGTAWAANPVFASSRRAGPAVEAAKKVSAAVVSVTAIQYVQNPYQQFYEEFFGPFVPYGQSQSRVQEVPMMGSGVIIDKAGYVLTNHHVIEGASNVTVTLPDGREFKATVVDADVYVDVAVLKIEGKDLPVAQLGTSRDLMIGEGVMAIGNPFGQLYDDPRPSVSVGVVSATGRYFSPQNSGNSTRVYQDMIQTDAAINPGNSGGPLVNLDGAVIGINTFIISRSGGSQGLGFAIPIDKARAVYQEVRQHGRIRTLLLDIEALALSRPLARRLGLPEDLKGALVTRVEPKGPAQQAGLIAGDVIVRIDSRKVRDPEDLYAYFVTQQVGAEMEMELVRDGKSVATKYTVVEGK